LPQKHVAGTGAIRQWKEKKNKCNCSLDHGETPHTLKVLNPEHRDEIDPKHAYYTSATEEEFRLTAGHRNLPKTTVFGTFYPKRTVVCSYLRSAPSCNSVIGASRS